jgi:hypothetical protein
MRTILSLVLLLLLLLISGGQPVQATEYPEGWINPAGAHPWGGDESPVDPGESNYTTIGTRSAATISLTTNPLLDIILNYLMQPPTQPVRVEPTHPVYDRSSELPLRFRAVRKYDTSNRLR